MEPRIQYAKTSDGVNIAYWTLGKGPPLVYMPFPPVYSHTQMEWQVPELRRWYEALAERVTLVRYDSRGMGLSDREVSDFGVGAMVRDLTAVVGQLDLERFALIAQGNCGPASVKFAADQPDRVTHLILRGTSADSTAAPARLRPARALAGEDWKMFTETWAHEAFGWSAGELARRFAELRRESTSPEATLAMWESFEKVDVSELLEDVRVPTLVIGYRGDDDALAASKRLASSIPEARLTIRDGRISLNFMGDDASALDSIDEFLGVKGSAAKPAEPGAFRTILFTDVEGSTALTDRLGDARARELLREHERITREALEKHGGSEVKTMGDGFMASFGSATKALECAIAVQRAFADWNASAGATGPSTGSGRTEELRVRIGLNAGEPIAEDEDLFGTAVNMAARIAAKADGREILCSDVVRQLVAGKRFLFNDRGETELRGFEDPVRVYEVRWERSE